MSSDTPETDTDDVVQFDELHTGYGTPGTESVGDYPEETYERIVELYEDGWLPSEISAELDVPVCVITPVVSRAGVFHREQTETERALDPTIRDGSGAPDTSPI